MNRDEFMAFFRADDFQDHMSTDDCIEIFLNVLKGSSDIDENLLHWFGINYGMNRDQLTAIMRGE